MSDKSIRTILVEDHEVTRLGIKLMLNDLPEISIVAEASDGGDAVCKAKELNPDLILMDIGLPGMDGIQCTKAIKNSINAKVIMITSHGNNEDIFAGLSAGAEGYCLKGVSSRQLTTAIQSVMDGALWLDSGIAKQVVRAASVGAMNSESKSITALGNFGLSEREREVLALLVDGMSNQEMAERLYLSTETIKTHMRHIMEKLRVADRTQAAVKAVKQGLVA